MLAWYSCSLILTCTNQRTSTSWKPGWKVLDLSSGEKRATLCGKKL